MKKITSALVGVLLTLSMYSQTWTPLNSGTTADLISISFVNDNTGWAAGYGGTIIKTTDGTTFTNQTSGTTVNLYTICFVDANNGVVVGDGSTILRTTNGGTTWSSVNSPIIASFRNVWFLNSSIGFITGGSAGSSAVLKTIDGGASWSILNTGLPNVCYNICFANTSVGWAGDYNGNIVKTTDGGNTWSFQTSGLSTSIIALSCINATTVEAGSMNGSVIRTVNGGTTWTPVTTGTTDWFADIQFISSSIGYDVGGNVGGSGDGRIYKTTDGGLTWNAVYTVSGKLQHGLSLSGNSGYACGNGGTIEKITGIGFAITTSGSNPLCHGDQNGIAAAAIIVGVPPYTYSWNSSPVQSSSIARNLGAGSYTVTVTDSLGNIATGTVTLTDPTLLSFTTSTANPMCWGANTGVINATAAGGTGALQYSDDGGTTWQSSNIFNNLAANTYQVAVKDANNCVAASQSVTITQPNLLISFTSTSTNELCHGGSNASITVNATGGTGTLSYSDNNGSTFQSANLFSGLTAGTYPVIVKDGNGCQAPSQSVTINQPSAITTSQSHTNVNCYSGSDGSASITASGGTGILTYNWLPMGGTNNAAINLPMGTYTITVTDSNSCTASVNVIITQPAAALSFTNTSVNILCSGNNTGSITIAASGGTGAVQYSIDNGNTFQLSNIFNNLAAATYQLVVKDANNCVALSQSVTITQPTTLPSFTYTSLNELCHNINTGNITVNATGGTGAFLYSDNNGSTYHSSNQFNGLAAGIYPVLVKDANGCVTPVQNVSITQPSAITTSIAQTNVSCYAGNNGRATITARGGTGILTYNWLPAGGTDSTASNLSIGTYSVTVTDNNGCTASGSVTITQPLAAITISTPSVTNTICGSNIGQVTVTVNGGTGAYTYLWSDGATTPNDLNIPAGNYSLTVTDANGCTATSAVATVGTNHPTLAFSAIATTGTAPFFAGFTNGTPNMANYNFTWYWGDATSTASNSANVTHTFTYAGFYDVSLVAINIANGCADTLKKVGYIFVSGTGCSQTAIISPNTNYAGCAGDTLVLTASTNAASNFYYQWNSNSIPIGGAQGITLKVTQAGYYSVTVVQGGCPVTSGVVSATFNTVPPTPQITTTGSILPCVGGSVTLTASTVTGGNYLWNTGATTQSITVSTAGTYSVTEKYGTSSCSNTSAPYYLGTSLPGVPVCMVTVDPTSTHNIVVWEKTGVTPSVDSFRVYREVMTNVYSNVGSVSNDSLSEFHDYGANPNVTSFKYKLAAIDTCGSISALSDYHNTIHLKYLGNGNLQWTLYQIENAANPVSFYVVNRDDNNTGNYLPISTTIPGGNSTYTDINYSSYPNASYRVDVNWSISCTPTRSVLTTTHSNVIHPGGITTYVSQAASANSIAIYPNPSAGVFEISINDNANKKTIINVFNYLGEVIYSEETVQNKTSIDLSGNANGIYFAEIITDKGRITKKVVVEK